MISTSAIAADPTPIPAGTPTPASSNANVIPAATVADFWKVAKGIGFKADPAYPSGPIVMYTMRTKDSTIRVITDQPTPDKIQHVIFECRNARSAAALFARFTSSLQLGESQSDLITKWVKSSTTSLLRTNLPRGFWSKVSSRGSTFVLYGRFHGSHLERGKATLEIGIRVWNQNPTPQPSQPAPLVLS
jgi:hypothetical protein